MADSDRDTGDVEAPLRTSSAPGAPEEIDPEKLKAIWKRTHETNKLVVAELKEGRKDNRRTRNATYWATGVVVLVVLIASWQNQGAMKRVDANIAVGAGLLLQVHDDVRTTLAAVHAANEAELADEEAEAAAEIVISNVKIATRRRSTSPAADPEPMAAKKVEVLKKRRAAKKALEHARLKLEANGATEQVKQMLGK